MKRGPWLVMIFITFVTVGYQACSPAHHAMDSASSASAFSTYRQDSALSWATKGRAPRFNSLGKVERWEDSLGKSLLLMPPLKGSAALDMDRSPARLANSSSFIRFDANQVLAPASGDFAELVSDEYFLLMIVKDLAPPADGDKVLRLFDLYPTDSSQGGHLVVDITEESNAFKFSLLAWFNGSTYAVLEHRISKDAAKKPIVIAMNYPRLPENLELSINGERPTVAATRVGDPPFLGRMGRQLSVHGAGYGGRGAFSFAELSIWKRSLHRDEQDAKVNLAMNAWANDVDIAPPTEPTDPEPEDNPIVYSDLSSTFSSCVACHGTKMASRTNLLNSSLNDPESGTSLWVIPGNPGASLLVDALEHRNGASPMPKGGGKLSTNQINMVKRWIEEGAK